MFILDVELCPIVQKPSAVQLVLDQDFEKKKLVYMGAAIQQFYKEL